MTQPINRFMLPLMIAYRHKTMTNQPLKSLRLSTLTGLTILMGLLSIFPLQAAELTLDNGVVVKMGSSAQLVVRDKLISGQGVTLTSVKDDAVLGPIGATVQVPAKGDWLGLRLEKSTASFGALNLNGLSLRYGGGTVDNVATAALTVRGISPNFTSLQLANNQMGLLVLEGANPQLTKASLTANTIGIRVETNSNPSITDSQLVGNSVFAIENLTPDTVVTATGNWWGHASGPNQIETNPSGQGNGVSAGVDYDGFTGAAGLYNPSVQLAAPSSFYENHDILLDLACINASEYRISETNNFTNASVHTMDSNPLQVAYTVSEGDGLKNIYVQYRSADGATTVAQLSGGILIDTQPPAVGILNPVNGSQVDGPITLEASASDASGISKVQFYIDGQLVSTKTATPYTYAWNTANVVDGAHTLRVVATDAVGRTAEQISAITFARFVPPPDTQGPQISNILLNNQALTDGMTLTRNGTLVFSASDPSGLALVEVLLDGSKLAGPSGSGTYSTLVNIDNVANGSHTLTIKATDSVGNLATVSRSLTVAHEPPSAPVIVQPLTGTTTGKSSIALSGTAPANTSVQIHLNAGIYGAPIAVGSDGKFAGTVTLAKGINTIQATATDQYGTSPASLTVTVTLDDTIPASPSNLTALAQSAGKIRLSWSAGTDANATGYNLYRLNSSFDSIESAQKVNTSVLTSTIYDDLPSQDGTWYYRVVAVNQVGTASIPSNIAQAVSDNTLPKALSIEYTPQGSYDAATHTFGQGQIHVKLTASEALPSVPFLSVVPPGGSPLTVVLSQVSETLFEGSFNVTSATVPGIATALFSGRDNVGNRGTEIVSGASLKLDTAGPMLSGIALDPVSPIDNTTVHEVTATLTFSKPPKTPPTVSVKLSGTGRTPISLTNLTPEDDITWTGNFNLPNDGGAGEPETLTFSFQAVDSLNNVSTKVLANNRFQVYQGNLPPLAVPFALTAQAQPGGKVKLAWQAVEGSDGYQLYRQAPGETTLSALTRPSGTDYIDQTEVDGTYQYSVASIRKANNQEALSGQSPPVSVKASATPPGNPQNLTLKLTGQGIVATWQAPSQGSPVASYNLYRSTGTQITDLAGLTPLKTGIKELGSIDAKPSPSQGAYAVTALDAAGNESAPSNSAYLNASLLPVSKLTIQKIADGLPIISWQPPNSDVSAYKVYADTGIDHAKVALTSGVITGLNYIDSGYNGGDRLYTVASVDSNAVEMPRSLLLPNIESSITGGLPLQRGVMNQLMVQVVNHSGHTLNNVRAVIKLPINQGATQFKTHISAPVTLEAQQTRLLPVVVGGYDTLPDTIDAQVQVEIAPNEGELVVLAHPQALQITEGSLVVGMSTADFTRGATGKLKLTIENTTDTEVELLTATQNGQAASSELRFKILDQDGNVLATQPYKQALGANVVSLANGQTVARIPAHASYVSDEFLLTIPAASPATIRVVLEVDKLRYHSGQEDEVSIKGRGSEKAVSLIDTAYFGTIANITPANSYGDQTIVISGQAIDRASNDPLPNTRLKLVLNQQGFERVLSVTTDNAGHYEYTLVPTLTDSGLYKVSAIHPDMTDRPEQKSFMINRITVGPTPYKLDVPKNYPFTINFNAKAGPGASATNLKLTYDAASQTGGQLPAGITLQLPASVNIKDKQTVNLPVIFTAAESAQTTGSVVLNVTSDEHSGSPLGQLKIDYKLTEAKPFVASTPSFVETGLASGSSQIESVVIENKGLADANNLSFKLTKADGSAAPPWASISSKPDGTLALGAKRSIDLAFAPPDGTAEGVYTFKLVMTGDNVPAQNLNVYVSVTLSGQGNVLFKASDIYTATVDKNGHLIQGLAGATVTVQNEEVTTITQQLVTDSLGEALFQNLPAGRYQFRAKAANHQEIGGRLTVKPGITYNQPVFLQYNLITVEWSVKEITIEDRYDITLNATFETDVPAPVVVMQPASVNLPKMGVGDIFYGELVLTNYGLVRADNVVQELPASDNYFRYEFLVDVPNTLEAKQRVTIPYRVIALQSLESTAGTETSTGGGCYSYSKSMKVKYDYKCANGVVSAGQASTYWFSASNSSCPVGSGSGSGGGGGGIGGLIGGGFGGGGSGVGTPLPGIPNSCNKTPKGNGQECS